MKHIVLIVIAMIMAISASAQNVVINAVARLDDVTQMKDGVAQNANELNEDRNLAMVIPCKYRFQSRCLENGCRWVNGRCAAFSKAPSTSPTTEPTKVPTNTPTTVAVKTRHPSKIPSKVSNAAMELAYFVLKTNLTDNERRARARLLQSASYKACHPGKLVDGNRTKN